MSKITYENKETIFESSLPNKNKVTAQDMNEIKNAVNKLTAIKYGTCNSAASTQIKEAQITDGTQLENGDIIVIKFTNTNTYNYTSTNKPQIKIGNTTYNVLFAGASFTGTNSAYMGQANDYLYYMVDGTNLNWLGHSRDNNTTYTNEGLGQGYGTCSTAESTAAKVVTLSSYALVKGGIVAVKFTNGVPANATMNVNSKGAKEMWYKGAKITAGVIKAGDLATFIYDGTRYQMISLDSGTGSGSADTVPIGSIFDYDGATVPSGYEQVSDYDILYSSNTGIGGAGQSVPLSSNPTTYSRIDIIAGESSGGVYTNVYTTYPKYETKYDLSGLYMGVGWASSHDMRIEYTSTSIKITQQKTCGLNTVNTQEDTAYKIIRVIGYK